MFSITADLPFVFFILRKHPSIGSAFLCHDSAIQASLIALDAPSVRLFSRFAEQVLDGQRLAGLRVEGSQGYMSKACKATHRCLAGLHTIVLQGYTLLPRRATHRSCCSVHLAVR